MTKELVLNLRTAGVVVTGSIIDGQMGVTVPIVTGTIDGQHLTFTARMTDPVRLDIGVDGTIDGDIFTGTVTINGGGVFPLSGTRAA